MDPPSPGLRRDRQRIDANEETAETVQPQIDGQKIELVELGLDQALDMIETGEIQNGKAIMLLQHAKLKGLID